MSNWFLWNTVFCIRTRVQSVVSIALTCHTPVHTCEHSIEVYLCVSTTSQLLCHLNIYFSSFKNLLKMSVIDQDVVVFFCRRSGGRRSGSHFWPETSSDRRNGEDAVLDHTVRWPKINAQEYCRRNLSHHPTAYRRNPSTEARLEQRKARANRSVRYCRRTPSYVCKLPEDKWELWGQWDLNFTTDHNVVLQKNRRESHR